MEWKQAEFWACGWQCRCGKRWIDKITRNDGFRAKVEFIPEEIETQILEPGKGWVDYS